MTALSRSLGEVVVGVRDLRSGSGGTEVFQGVRFGNPPVMDGNEPLILGVNGTRAMTHEA